MTFVANYTTAKCYRLSSVESSEKDEPPSISFCICMQWIDVVVELEFFLLS